MPDSNQLDVWNWLLQTSQAPSQHSHVSYGFPAFLASYRFILMHFLTIRQGFDLPFKQFLS